MGKVKQMNKRELAKLRKWTDTLTDKELEKEYLRWHHYIIILNYVAGTKMLLFQYLA